MEALETLDPLEVLGWQYDIVCNGVELSSGAIRNHQAGDHASRPSEIAGHDFQRAWEEKFGGMFRVLLKYRCPASWRNRAGH